MHYGKKKICGTFLDSTLSCSSLYSDAPNVEPPNQLSCQLPTDSRDTLMRAQPWFSLHICFIAFWDVEDRGA